MFAFIAILLIILSAILIFVVLIQPGKGEMLTGIGGISGQFNSVLGTKKATDLLKNITIYSAIAIAVICLVYNLTNTPEQAVNNQGIPSTLDQDMEATPPATPDVAPPAEPASDPAPEQAPVE